MFMYMVSFITFQGYDYSPLKRDDLNVNDISKRNSNMYVQNVFILNLKIIVLEISHLLIQKSICTYSTVHKFCHLVFYNKIVTSNINLTQFCTTNNKYFSSISTIKLVLLDN